MINKKIILSTKNFDTTLTLFIENKKIGSITFQKFEDNKCDIINFKVKRKYREQGYGSLLMKECLDVLKKDNKKIELIASPNNNKSNKSIYVLRKEYKCLIKFYSKFGFTYNEKKTIRYFKNSSFSEKHFNNLLTYHGYMSKKFN